MKIRMKTDPESTTMIARTRMKTRKKTKMNLK